MKSVSIISLMIILSLTITPCALVAQIKISAYTIAGGGGTMNSGNMKITGTIGQPAIGKSSNENNNLISGFWYEKIIATHIADVNQLRLKFRLEQNYPNPFNPSTTIKYSLKEESIVRIKIYNSIGQQVGSFLNELKLAGIYSFLFNAGNLASGIYFYRIEAVPTDGKSNNFITTKKMILIK